MKSKVKNIKVCDNLVEIDWNKPQLVITSRGRIYLTTGEHTYDAFYGTLLTKRKRFKVGHYTLWKKNGIVKALDKDVKIILSNN